MNRVEPYIPLLIWLLIVFLEAGRHVYLIKVKHISPNKFRSLAVRCLIATALGLWEVILLDKNVLEMILTYLFSGWFLHDSITGFKIHGRPWRLNDNGWLDRKQRYSVGDFPAWCLKGIAGLTLIAMYFWNE